MIGLLRRLLGGVREHWTCLVYARANIIRRKADAIRAMRGQRPLGPLHPPKRRTGQLKKRNPGHPLG